MGLDSRYDCFDCQRNKFEVEGKDALKMEALFRIPRPTFPGYLQNKIVEELRAGEAPITVKRPQTDAVRANMHSQGQMFGLTFWENWYILGESKPTVAAKFIPKALAMGREKDLPPDMKLVFYTGHTLQGSYKGMFFAWVAMVASCDSCSIVLLHRCISLLKIANSDTRNIGEC